MPSVLPLPPWTTLPAPGPVEALAALLLAPLSLALGVADAVVGVGAAAAAVVVGAAWAATVWVVPLSFLPISTPSRRKTPSSAIAPIATSGDHCGFVPAAGGAAPAIA